MSFKRLLLLWITSLIFFSCNSQRLVSGRLKNLTGLESCNWIIELDKPDKQGNKTLEPGNLSTFKITLKEGQKIKLRYKETNAMSTCMAGKSVEIEMIRDN